MAINEKMKLMQHLNNAERKAVKHHSTITKAFIFKNGGLDGRHDLILELGLKTKAWDVAGDIENLMWAERKRSNVI